MDVRGVSVYSDSQWLPVGVPPVPFLYPVWGMPPEDPNDPRSGAFETWMTQGRERISLTSIDDADFVVLPFDFREAEWRPALMPVVHRAGDRARAARKPFVVFYDSDSSAPLPIPNAIAFRQSVDRGPRYGVTEFCMPGWIDDPLVKWGNRDPRIPPVKPPRARVSFCGFTSPVRAVGAKLRGRLKERARRILGTRHELVPRLSRTPLELRRHALGVFEQSAEVDTSFIQRDHFYAGAAFSNEDFAWKTQVRREFVENMLESDYVLCVRGAGNGSMRYFETMACSKVPIQVDTGGGLPYDFLVDWRTRGPWIPVEDLEEGPGRVRAFHDALSEADFQRLCRENREWFDRWLTPEGFFQNFRLHLERFPRV